MATRTVGTFVLVLFAAVTAFAQSSIGFGPQAGFYKSQDADEGRLMGGAALRLRLSGLIGVEASINYRHEEYGNGFVSATSWPIMVTGLVYPIPVVYGAIGAGWYNTTVMYDYSKLPILGPPNPPSETEQEFGWHFGGGIELPLGSVVKLVGDVRYVFLNYDFNKFPGSNGVNSNFYVITAGLLFGL